MAGLPDSKILNQIYARRRQEAERLALERKEETFRKHPRLRELLREELIAAYALVEMASNDEAGSEAREVLRQSRERRKAYMFEMGIAPDFDQVRWHCSDCQDRGYIRGNLCHCAMELQDELKLKPHFGAPADCQFKNFDSGLFSDQVDERYFKKQLSPREGIEGLRKILVSYVENFAKAGQVRENFFLTGRPGTGKTFLAACTANALKEAGYRTAFLRASRLFDLFARERTLKLSFNPAAEQMATVQSELAEIKAADLVVLDDLGTERDSQAAFSDLINLMDERKWAGRPLIITSNLSALEIGDLYDERIRSRLVGDYTLFLLQGPDVRLQLGRRRQGGVQ